jgi:hypothetical protein
MQLVIPGWSNTLKTGEDPGGFRLSVSRSLLALLPETTPQAPSQQLIDRREHSTLGLFILGRLLPMVKAQPCTTLMPLQTLHIRIRVFREPHAVGPTAVLGDLLVRAKSCELSAPPPADFGFG